MATSSADAERDTGNEESEEEGSDESEDLEPKLKYDRITGDLTDILKKDCASCMAVHGKFLAIGTHWGSIHILDYLGDKVKGKEFNAHSTTVNMISVDDNGDYIASCSDDGKVNIIGLYTSDNNQVLNFDRPVKAVALDPYFFKSSSKQFVSGDDKLILNEKGFFNRHKTSVLHQGEGPIREIKWKGDFIAWANDHGVKVFDMSSKNRITFINKDTEHRADLYHCCLYWKDARTLLVGWADSVKLCIVKDRQTMDVRDLPSRYVEIVAMFTTDFFVCGIAHLNDNIVVLCYEKESEQEGGGKPVSNRPHLRIIEPHMDSYDEVSDDALSIRGYQEYRCNDYHLESIIEENLFYIVSPKDIVVARPRDQDDHIGWLVDHERFEEAMEAAVKHSKEIKKTNFIDIGKQYLNYLIDDSEFEDAARLCVKLCGRDKELWEEEAYRFTRIKQLKALAPYLPRRDPQLSPAIYELVLNEFLHSDNKVFLQFVKEWPCDLYSIGTIVSAVLDKLDKDRNNKLLLQALAELYSYDKAFDRALAIYLKLKHKDVFTLIHKHNLFDSISDKIVQLMEFDQEQAVTMLIDNMAKISVEQVVQQLRKTPQHLHNYLDRLFKKDPHLTEGYADDQVKLYAEYDRPRLLPFLRNSNNYTLDMALQVCQTREFVPEEVFLLGRMGNLQQALRLITEKLRNVDQAIEFCKEHNDKELWEDLITYSMDKPRFITGLLNSIGTHVDPIILIHRIQEGMEIPGLRDSLVKIMLDYNLQISLREGCRRILVADSFNLMARLVKTQKKAISVDTSHACVMCQERILVNDLRYASDVRVFFCNHIVHEDCLPVMSDTCPICTTQKRRPGSKVQNR